MKALYFETFGSSDVLKYGELPDPVINNQEVLVQTAYIGLNFADIYRRRGGYHIEPNSPYPYINGYEASGIIIDAEAKHLIGKSVLFVDVPFANAEKVAVPLEKIIFLPDEISLKEAATIGLQGLTADFLVHDLGKNKPKDKAFVTGISGGVGQILAQMLIADGVEVWGSSSAHKVQVALDFGAKKVLPSRHLEWIPDYKGQFDSCYDGVGTTLKASIDLIKNKGKVIFFGMAAGTPPAIDFIELLSQSKSILTGDLWDFLSSFEERKVRSNRLFTYFKEEKIKVTEPHLFALSEGKAAHDFLENGKNVGKILLKP